MPIKAIKPIDTLLGMKVALLAPGLTHAERRVLSAMIEHFNRDTGQCDPTIERMAELLGMCTRTAERAVEGLASKGLILFFRHGGRSNRNQYEIVWAKLDELRAAWKEKFEAAARARATNLSPRTRHSSRREGDSRVGQTYSNLPNRTYSQHRSKEEGQRPTPAREAARTQAQRRIDTALRLQPAEAHNAAYTVVDDAVWDAAIEAEVQRRGSGVEFLLRELEEIGVPTAHAKASDDFTGPSSAVCRAGGFGPHRLGSE